MSKISLTFKAKKKRIKSDQELRNESIKFNEQNKRLITGNHTKFDKNDLKNSELIIKCIEQNQWIKPKQKLPNLEMDTNQSNTNTNATKNGTNNNANNDTNSDTNNNNTNNDNNSNNKSNNDNETNGNSNNDMKMDDITKAAVKVLTNDDNNNDDDDGYVAPIPLTDSTPYLVIYDKKGKSTSNGKSLNKIMMKNMAPGVSEVKDENKKYMLDYLQRPDDPTLDVYDKIPIESFGRAMLLGMGWNPNDQNNKTNNINNNVEIRPKGLGVGAKLSKDKIDQMYGKKRRRIGEQKASEKYKNFIDNGNGDKNSSESSRIKPPKKKRKTEYGLQLFNKNASNDTVNDDINSNGNNIKTIKANNTSINGKHKNESPKMTYNNKGKITWASKGLLVRIVNKKYGKYFKKKGIIYDIFSLNKLSIKMDDGRLLNVFEDDICTVIPKNGKYVVILNGKYKNEKAMIIQKNRDNEVANVQIQNRLDIIKISYDDICAC